jgi:hypothetical protein
MQYGPDFWNRSVIEARALIFVAELGVPHWL